MKIRRKFLSIISIYHYIKEWKNAKIVKNCDEANLIPLMCFNIILIFISLFLLYANENDSSLQSNV